MATLKTRVQLKHDVEANWALAVNFVPLAGEVVVFDPDDNNPIARIKIGDGSKKLSELDFVAESDKYHTAGTWVNGTYTLQGAGGASNIAISLPLATAQALGAVKSSTTGKTADRDYAVEVKTDGTMKVNVPWIDTTYTLADFDITVNADDINKLSGTTGNIQEQINNKVDKDGNKVLSTNDFTNDYKNKLDNITSIMDFKGTVTKMPPDGTYKKGDVVLYGNKEYVYDGSAWTELGDEGSYALKTTTINGHALSSNITLTPSDLGLGVATSSSAGLVKEGGDVEIDAQGIITIPELATLSTTVDNMGIAVRESVTINAADASIIDIPIEAVTRNAIAVFHNGIMLTPGINYLVLNDTNQIQLIDYTANVGDIFTFCGNTDFGVQDSSVKSVNSMTGDVILTAADVGARADNWLPLPSDIDAVPTSRTINGKALTEDIALVASDINALSDTYTPPTATANMAGTIKVSSVNATAVGVNSESTMADRYYPIELNSDGKAIVNVPWEGSVYTLDSFGVNASAAELNYTKGVTSGIQNQLNAKAPLASPTLTGVPTAPTAALGTNTTQIATTAFVDNAITEAYTSKTMFLTLSANNWNDHIQQISITGLEPGSNGIIGIAPNITDRQLNIAEKAKIYVSDQTTNTLTLKAAGIQPNIDIPAVIIIYGVANNDLLYTEETTSAGGTHISIAGGA